MRPFSTTLLTIILALGLLVACGGDPPVPDVAEREPPITYLSLGDSLAVGVGASEPAERGYAPLYREHLAATTDREVEFENLGVSGETSESFIGDFPDGDSQLRRAVDAMRENPECVVTLSIGGNDLLRVAGASDAERREAVDRFGFNLNYILRTLKESSDRPPEVAVFTIYNPLPGSFTDRWADRANDVIRSVAGRQGVSVARADRAFEGREREYTHFSEQQPDIHPNDRGYRVLAETLIESTSPS
jgi:acyl-CoA thioesterase-1